jgi:hypothetical protein
MTGETIAILMARQSTQRNLSEPRREARTPKPRRAAARALLTAARRLDPAVA